MCCRLGHQSGNHVSRNVCKPVSAALVFKGEFFVVEPHQVHYGSVEVVHMNGVFDDVVSEFVGFSVNDTGFHAAAGHPDGEAAGMVIAAVVVCRHFALAIIGAAEFAAPDHERLVEQPALFEVGNERRGGTVHVHGLAGHFIRQVAVLVPSLVVKLDEAHPAL